MKHMKAFTLAGYAVEYVDLRDPKPRERRTETAVFTVEEINAAQLLGLEFTDVIKRRYQMGGYHVLSIGKAPRRAVAVNLGALYQQEAERGF